MFERYIVPEVAPQATHDFISALIEHHTQHKVSTCITVCV